MSVRKCRYSHLGCRFQINDEEIVLMHEKEASCHLELIFRNLDQHQNEVQKLQNENEHFRSLLSGHTEDIKQLKRNDDEIFLKYNLHTKVEKGVGGASNLDTNDDDKKGTVTPQTGEFQKQQLQLNDKLKKEIDRLDRNRFSHETTLFDNVKKIKDFAESLDSIERKFARNDNFQMEQIKLHDKLEEQFTTLKSDIKHVGLQQEKSLENFVQIKKNVEDLKKSLDKKIDTQTSKSEEFQDQQLALNNKTEKDIAELIDTCSRHETKLLTTQKQMEDFAETLDSLKANLGPWHKELQANADELKDLAESMSFVKEKLHSFSTNEMYEKIKKDQIELQDKMDRELAKHDVANTQQERLRENVGNVKKNVEELKQSLKKIEDDKKREKMVEKQNIDDLKNSLKKVEDSFVTNEKFEKYQKNHIDLHTNMEKEVAKLKREVASIDRQQDQSKDDVGNVKKKVEDLRKSLDEQEGVIEKKMESKMQNLAMNVDSRETIFVWKIDGFSEKLKDAKNGLTTKLYSEPFHTNSCGYKLRLLCCPNGEGDGENTHLSVYHQLMKGEMDNNLEWPFKHDVSLIILNQIDKIKHVEYSETWNSGVEQYCSKPTSETNRGYGWAKMISHADLLKSSSPYLQNDVLYIKCIVKIGDMKTYLGKVAEVVTGLLAVS